MRFTALLPEAMQMYSEKIRDLLEREGIDTGDTVEFEKGKIKITGKLMPNTEANGEDILVIKLANGYNVGVSFSGSRLKLVKKGESNFDFPKAATAQDPRLPKVSLIYTGGTIGSKIDYKTGGVYMLLKPEELLYEIPELSKIARISVTKLFSMSSEDMSYKEWQAIAERVASEINNGARGVVVTIGTDTMHYASAALSFMLQDLNAPVVLTGSQRSSDRGSSDAFMNIICATTIAATSDIAEVGICMHDSSSDSRCSFIRGTKARKMHTSRRDAFRAINDKPIAYVDANGNISYNNDYKRVNPDQKKTVSAVTGYSGKVAIVKAYPDADPSILKFYEGKDYDGIIIEGTGLGHVPVAPSSKEMSWLPWIKSAVDKGVIVGITSQCIYGRVNRSVYRNLRLISSAGAVYCEDMTAETAYVKLSWLLKNYGKEKAREMLPNNLRGEITSRTKFETFMV